MHTKAIIYPMANTPSFYTSSVHEAPPTNTSPKQTAVFSEKVSTVHTNIPSLWWTLSTAAVLFVAVITMTVVSAQRNEAKISNLLISKGEALIWAVESSLRMGRGASMRLQATLEQMIGPDIHFIAIAMPDGTILAHNDASRLGEMLNIEGEESSETRLHALSQKTDKSDVHWFTAHMENTNSFVVYRRFMPKQIGREQGMPPPPHPPTHNLEQFPHAFPHPPPSLHSSNKHEKPDPQKQPLIFLGLDISRHEKDRMFDLAGGILFISMTTLLIVYYALRAHESRRRQHFAEGQVRELEKEVQRKEKMAAIGNLAAGVAHEIRNPLSSIKGYATYFGQRFPADSEDRQAAQVMVREVDRLNRVITDLIGLSRPTDVRAVPVDMGVVVEHALHLLRQDTEKRHVRMHFTPPTQALPLALIDIDRFGQALLNVCLNAIEAMPEAGGDIFISIYTQGKDRLCLEIRDTGVGIPEKDISHIFDPYFTTKGQGTGLGLATVHKIIEAHGGEIFVSSRHSDMKKRTGTIFCLLLPLAVR